MTGIIRVFLDAFRQLRGNIIAVVMTCGLILLPSLYAWFCILAFWDPVDNTGNLSVAVANNDAGYESDLFPARINVGENVVSGLRANDKFHWVFVDEEEAKGGVESGAYYAAIVIPGNFSANMISVFSDHMENPTIDYYVNDKENAIASHITSIGASTLQEDIDQTFMKTVTSIALETNSSLAEFMSGDGIQSYAANLISHPEDAADEMSQDASQVDAFASLLDQAQVLVSTATGALEKTSDVGSQVKPLVDQASQGMDEASSGTNAVASLAAQALSKAKGAMTGIQDSANAAFDDMGKDPAAAQKAIAAMQGDLALAKDAYADARKAVKAVDPKSPLLATIDSVIGEIDKASTALTQVSEDLKTGVSDMKDARAKVSATVGNAISALDGIQSDYESKLKSHLDSLRESLSKLGADAQGVTDDLQKTASDLTGAAEPLVASIEEVRDSLGAASKLLKDSAGAMVSAKDELANALDSGNLDEVKRIIGNDPAALAEALSAPTQVNKHPVYPMADFGSAMNPFYTSLALFIGVLFMIIILQVKLTPERAKRLGSPKPYQEYLGNLLFFIVIAEAQAMLTCAGNVFFLGVQCDNIALYFLTGALCGLVFVNLAYALVYAFADIGRAICLLLLVIQIAGSGGIMPIQLSTPVFQAIYPWLPVVHSMAMFEGAIAGIYGNQFLLAMGQLTAFIVPSLLIGLVLHKPIDKVNDFIEAQLAKTGFM